MAVPRFTTENLQLIFQDKHIVVIGDSVQRSVYKDLVCLLREDRLLTLEELKEKGELTFQDDTLLEGGVKTGLHNGTNYREVRKYKQDNTTIMFYFVTRCYGEYMQSILDDFKLDPPHVIIMNSSLWDLHRYGKMANSEYIENMSKLLHAVDLAVPDEDRLFIWNATLPVRKSVKAGFLPPGVDQTLPAEDIRKANWYVRDQIKMYSKRFIFLDLHQIFYKHLDLRVKDGVHWNDFAHRKVTCLLLSEISKHWNFELPSKLPMSPGALPSSVSSVRSKNASSQPQSLLEIPPLSRNGPNGPTKTDLSMGHQMNNGVQVNGFRGDFPGRYGPRSDVRSGPMLNGHRPHGPQLSGPGLRVHGPLVPRLNIPQVPRMDGPPRSGRLGEDPVSHSLLGNAPAGNHLQSKMPRNHPTRRGRTRSATAGNARFHPPPWLTDRPYFFNNNESLPPRSVLNDTYPPSGPMKRKVADEFDQTGYKFPRKFL